jgi:hypothetical protein
MITFFTTPKQFKGENIITQKNALRSWKQFSPECEIIVFDKFSDSGDVFNELKVTNITDIKKFSDELPLPLVNEMFNKIQLIANNPICCYINSDIILPENFLEIVVNLHNKLESNYLLVGQRFDLNVNSELDFSKNWEADFLVKYKNEMELHPPSGSDFFIFPKNQYGKEDIPPFAIGRPVWDNWLIYNGVKRKKLKVVDITNSTIVYHQNHIAAYGFDKSSDAATISNRNLMPKKEIFGYFLNQSNYQILNNKIKKRPKASSTNFIKSLINRIQISIVNHSKLV